MLFVVFEGIDGAGLSTHSHLLYEYLLGRGYSAVLTKEPTDGLIGGLIRACLRGEWRTDPLTLQLLFVADRSHHVNNLILPALRQGKIVISDRYMFSSIAYGTVSYGDYEWLKLINSRFPVPDVTFVLDVPVEVALQRIRRTRFGFELFENARLRRVREVFLKIAEEFGAVIVSTDRPVDEVQADVRRVVEEALRRPSRWVSEGS